MTTPTILETATDEAFVQESTDLLAGQIRAAIAAHGSCTLGLSGGSTPGPVYAALGQRDDVPWHKVHVFLVDDRFVLPGAADSNQRLVRETLLAHADIPEEQIVFPDTTLPIATCVDDYDIRMRSLLALRPADVLVLGMGQDGHIASLFPDDPDALAEDTRFVLHTTTDDFAIHDRITLGPKPIKEAAQRVLLIAGEKKYDLLKSLLSFVHDPLSLPSLPVALVLDERTEVIARK